MNWLDEFIRPRKTNSNIEFIKRNKSPVLSTSREEESDIEDNSNDQDDNSYCDSLFDQQTVENSTIEIASKKAKKSVSRKDKNERISDSVQIDAMKTITQFMKTRMAQPKESETEDDMFEKMIALELKMFPENLTFRLKHDINQVIYNYKLNQYNTMTPPMSRTPIGFHPAAASRNSDSSQPLHISLMELNSGLNHYNTITPAMSVTPIGSSTAVASPNADSGQPLRSPLMELSLLKWFQPL